MFSCRNWMDDKSNQNVGHNEQFFTFSNLTSSPPLEGRLARNLLPNFQGWLIACDWKTFRYNFVSDNVELGTHVKHQAATNYLMHTLCWTTMSSTSDLTFFIWFTTRTTKTAHSLNVTGACETTNIKRTDWWIRSVTDTITCFTASNFQIGDAPTPVEIYVTKNCFSCPGCEHFTSLDTIHKNFSVMTKCV